VPDAISEIFLFSGSNNLCVAPESSEYAARNHAQYCLDAAEFRRGKAAAFCTDNGYRAGYLGRVVADVTRAPLRES
jgi:hypothetical protein